MKKKFMVTVSHGTDNHDRANLAMTFVVSMIIEGLDVAMVMMVEAAELAINGVAETIKGRNMTPVAELFPIILKAGIPIYVCSPCAKTMGVTEDNIIPGAKIVTAPTAIAEMAEREVINF